ncbi:MAG: HAMP domain-containing sensor histidine kinase [Mucilaginibacter sp.]
MNYYSCIYKRYLQMLLSCCPLLLLNSCEKKTTSAGSAQFQPVIDSAQAEYDNGSAAKAVARIDSVFGGYKNLDVGQKFDYYYLNYNYYLHKVKDRPRAMLYADSMLDLFNSPEKKLKYTKDYALANFSKGDLLFDAARYNEAYRYYYQGKVIANNSFDICSFSDYSYRMGMTMYKQGHYREAATYFKNSYNEHSSCVVTFRTFYRRQELLNNAGISYSKLGKTDSAMYFFKQGLALIDREAARFRTSKNLLDVARGVIYGNQANIYIKQGDYTLAKQLLKKSFNINLRKGNDNQDAQLSELKLAHIYYDRNEQDSLFSLLQTVHRQSDTIKNQDAQADWNYLMAKYLIKKNDAKTAMAYFGDYGRLKDSIAAKQKMLKEADVNEQIKRLEKNYEFNRLKKDNEVQNILLKVAIVGGILLLIIISLVYSNWQRSKKNVAKLDSLNYQINEQNITLNNALLELNESSQEKDRILRTVAHDLRNPIGGISSLSGLMMEEAESEEQKDAINLIKETSDNSIELINEILEATNNKKTTLTKEPADVNSIISNSVELLRFKAAEKNQEIKTLLLDKPMELLLNREKIWRVISNLISNAIKFSPDNSSIWLTIHATEDGVQICVTDNGIGIPDDLKDKVFNMFTEAKRAGTAGEKSFGLGLSICRQIIESHDGKIWFENNPEGGTKFCISLRKAAV